jgi:hypothetical protein
LEKDDVGSSPLVSHGGLLDKQTPQLGVILAAASISSAAGHSIKGIALADDYIELFVEWAPNAATDRARRWLEQRGFRVNTTKSGVLLLGTKNQIEKAFSVSLENIKLPVNLQVPAELRECIESITIPKPRSYHR